MMLMAVHITNKSSGSHPEQLLWLGCIESVNVLWVDWLYLNGNFIRQQFVEALFCILCQVRFAVR